MRAPTLVALLLMAVFHPAQAHATEPWQDGSLGACVEAALPALRPEPFVSGFLFAPAAKSRGFALTAGGCVAFVAVGAPGIELVELGVHTDDGATLATDVHLGATARLEYCSAADQSFVLTAQVKAGRGTLHVFRVDGGLRARHAELAALDACHRGGDVIGAPLANIGAEPATVEATEWLAAGNADDLDAGAAVVGPPVTVEVEEHETMRTRFGREEPGCFVVIAGGSRTLHEFTASIERRDGAILVRARSERRRLRLPFCIDAPGTFALSIHGTSGRGDVAARWLRFREPSGPRVPGLEGSARAEFARLAAQLATAGFVARPHAWMHLRSRDRLAVPLSLAAGACVALSAAQPDADASVEIAVESANGHLLAFRNRTWRTPSAPVHVCAERADTLRIVVSPSSVRPTLALLVVGEALP
jgi:hypothetical protein